MYRLPHLDEGHPGALDGHHTHRLAELQVQDEDLSGIKQQHVVPLGWQVGQLQTVVQRHCLCATGPQRRGRTGKQEEKNLFHCQIIFLTGKWMWKGWAKSLQPNNIFIDKLIHISEIIMPSSLPGFTKDSPFSIFTFTSSWFCMLVFLLLPAVTLNYSELH